MFYLFYEINGQMKEVMEGASIKIFEDAQDAAEFADALIVGETKFVISSDEHERTIKGYKVFGQIFWRLTNGRNKPIIRKEW